MMMVTGHEVTSYLVEPCALTLEEAILGHSVVKGVMVNLYSLQFSLLDIKALLI